MMVDNQHPRSAGSLTLADALQNERSDAGNINNHMASMSSLSTKPADNLASNKKNKLTDQEDTRRDSASTAYTARSSTSSLVSTSILGAISELAAMSKDERDSFNLLAATNGRLSSKSPMKDRSSSSNGQRTDKLMRHSDGGATVRLGRTTKSRSPKRRTGDALMRHSDGGGTMRSANDNRSACDNDDLLDVDIDVAECSFANDDSSGSGGLDSSDRNTGSSGKKGKSKKMSSSTSSTSRRRKTTSATGETEDIGSSNKRSSKSSKSRSTRTRDESPPPLRLRTTGAEPPRPNAVELSDRSKSAPGELETDIIGSSNRSSKSRSPGPSKRSAKTTRTKVTASDATSTTNSTSTHTSARSQNRKTAVQFDTTEVVKHIYELSSTDVKVMWYSKECLARLIDHDIQVNQRTSASNKKGLYCCWRGLEHIQKQENKAQKIHTHIQKVLAGQATLRTKHSNEEVSKELAKLCSEASYKDRKKARWYGIQDEKEVFSSDATVESVSAEVSQEHRRNSNVLLSTATKVMSNVASLTPKGLYPFNLKAAASKMATKAQGSSSIKQKQTTGKKLRCKAA